MKRRLITQKAYAKLRGVTPQYVNKLVRSGKVPLLEGKIEARQADRAMAAFAASGRVIRPKRKATAKTKSSQGGRGGRRGPQRKLRHASPGRPATDPSAAGHRPGSATASLTAARAKREHFQSLTAELEYQRQTGLLLPAAEVLEAQRRQNANLRTRFRRLARSLAPTLAPLRTPAEVEAKLGEEIDFLLAELAADPLGGQPAPEGEGTPPVPSAGTQEAVA